MWFDWKTTVVYEIDCYLVDTKCVNTETTDTDGLLLANANSMSTIITSKAIQETRDKSHEDWVASADTIVLMT